MGSTATEATLPQDFDALRTLILDRRQLLPKRLAQIAAYALGNPDEIAFGTAASIAQSAGVQPSTLIRFAQHLGFDGFTSLQSVFRERLRERQGSYEERLSGLRGDTPGLSKNRVILNGFLSAASQSIQTISRRRSRNTDCRLVNPSKPRCWAKRISVEGCTPTDTHADLIERFARAGKAIFCEKPIDLNVKRVEECLAVVDETKATLMVGFNRRFDPHFAAVRKAIDDGAIGTVEMVTITSRDPGAPPAEYITRSGGIFRDMTIHDFDMARFLLGEEPVAVTAHASVLVDKKIGELGDYDSVSVILSTASGKQCVISNSRRATYGYDQRIEVHGSKGMVAAENQRPVSIEVANGNGYTRPPLHDFFMTRYTEAYANEIAAFIDAIATGAKAAPSGKDGLIALALADAALRSVKEGKTISL